MTNIRAINSASLFHWSWQVKVLIVFYTISFTATAVPVPSSNPGSASQWQASVQSSHENKGARVILPFVFEGLLTFREIASSEQNHSSVVNALDATGYSHLKIKEEENPYIVMEKINSLADKPTASGGGESRVMFSKKEPPTSHEKPDDEQGENRVQGMQIDQQQDETVKSEAPGSNGRESPMELEPGEQASVRPVTRIRNSLITSIEAELLKNHEPSDLVKLKKLKENIEQESMTDEEITLHKKIMSSLTQLHNENPDICVRLPDLSDAEIVDSLILLHKAGFVIDGDITTLRQVLLHVHGLSSYVKYWPENWTRTSDVHHVSLMALYILNHWRVMNEEEKDIVIHEHYTSFWITGLIIERLPEYIKDPGSGFQAVVDKLSMSEFYRKLWLTLGSLHEIYRAFCKALSEKTNLLPKTEEKLMDQDMEKYILEHYPFDALVRKTYSILQSSYYFFSFFNSKQYTTEWPITVPVTRQANSLRNYGNPL